MYLNQILLYLYRSSLPSVTGIIRLEVWTMCTAYGKRGETDSKNSPPALFMIKFRKLSAVEKQQQQQQNIKQNEYINKCLGWKV